MWLPFHPYSLRLGGLERAGKKKCRPDHSRRIPRAPRLREIPRITLILALILSTAAARSQTTDGGSQDELRRQIRQAYTVLQAGRYDSARAMFTAAAERSRDGASWASHLYCLNGIGESCLRMARYREARAILSRADSIGRTVLGAVDPGLIRTLHLRGHIALNEDDFAGAVSMFEEATSLTRRLTPEDSLGLAACFLMTGTTETRMGAYDRAERSYRAGLDVVRGDDPRSAAQRSALLLELARNHMARGTYGEARELLAALPQDTAVADPEFTIRVLQLLSAVEHELGEYSSSLRSGEEALARSMKLFGDRHPITVNQIARLGELQAAAGCFDQAVLYLQEAVASYGELEGGGRWALGSLHQRLSSAYREEGRLDSALVHADRAVELAVGSLGREHPGVAPPLENLAETYLALGRDEAALEPARRAQALYRSAALVGGADFARSCLLLAAVNLQRGEYPEALALADTALELLEGPARAKAWRIRGEALLGLASYAEARTGFAEALRLCGLDEPFGPDADARWMDLYTGREAVRSLLGFARAAEGGDSAAIRDLKTAYEACRLASAILADMRVRYLHEQAKLDLAVFGRGANTEALRLALRMRELTGENAYLDEAFSLAEAAKAGALIDALVLAEAERFSGIPAGLLETERSLKRELFACDTRLHEGAPPATALLARRFELQRALDSLLTLLATRHREFSELARRPEPVTAARAMELLDGRSALVEYALLDDRLVAFVVTSDRLACSVVPMPSDLAETVRNYCQSLRTFDVGGYAPRGRALGALLLDPVREAIAGKDRLLIVPDGDLWYLPFETLLTGDPGRDFTAMPYLVSSHEVTYLYSAGFMRELAGSGRLGTAAGFGGFAPAFDGTAGPAYASAQTGTGGELRRGRFSQLPQAAGEVEAIAETFARRHVGEATFIGEEATESLFRRRAAEFGFLHVASHTYVDEDHPGLTGMVFTRSGGAADDGVLHAGEMFDLKLRAQLVVLSSCQSGLGKIIPGEGLLAMTRGMFYSGARNVMVSLWDVYDTHARELMVRFYPALLEGQSIASSLRQAKRAMIANPRSAFPGKWGGFVHVGVD